MRNTGNMCVTNVWPRDPQASVLWSLTGSRNDEKVSIKNMLKFIEDKDEDGVNRIWVHNKSVGISAMNEDHAFEKIIKCCEMSGEYSQYLSNK